MKPEALGGQRKVRGATAMPSVSHPQELTAFSFTKSPTRLRRRKS